jgi:DNA-binding NarL/FixJ family response regulator
MPHSLPDGGTQSPAPTPNNGSQRPAGRESLAGGDQRLRVLIADHDGLARSMIRTSLCQADTVAIIATAGDGRQALELARYHQPTVLLVDTALPPDGGVELIGHVLRVSPQTRVLTVSVDDQQAALAALRAGAVGHITKDIDPDELARLVLRAADGEAIIPQQLIIPLLESLRDAPDARWRPLHSRLTTREWEIIELLAEGATTNQIVERLVLSHSTVYTHIKTVLRKLGVHSRRDAITAATRLRQEEASGTKPSSGSDHVHQSHPAERSN